MRGAVCARPPAMSARRIPGPADLPEQPDQPDQPDQRAIDSEWSTGPVAKGASGDADADDDSAFAAKDVEKPSEGVEELSTNERKWAEIMVALSTLGEETELPLYDAESGKPTITACVFIPLSIVGPVVLFFIAADWLHRVSVSFGRLF